MESNPVSGDMSTRYKRRISVGFKDVAVSQTRRVRELKREQSIPT
jgi:hypothetical protein